jgi:hypothetical protein
VPVKGGWLAREESASGSDSKCVAHFTICSTGEWEGQEESGGQSVCEEKSGGQMVREEESERERLRAGASEPVRVHSRQRFFKQLSALLSGKRLRTLAPDASADTHRERDQTREVSSRKRNTLARGCTFRGKRHGRSGHQKSKGPRTPNTPGWHQQSPQSPRRVAP